MSDTNFSFAVKLQGLNITAVIHCTSAKERIQIMKQVGDLTDTLSAPHIMIDIIREEEPIHGDLH